MTDAERKAWAEWQEESVRLRLALQAKDAQIEALVIAGRKMLGYHGRRLTSSTGTDIEPCWCGCCEEMRAAIKEAAS